MRIKLAGACIPLDGGIELLRVEGLKPRAKSRQLAWSELFDGFLDVFSGGHDRDIALAGEVEKGGMNPKYVGWVEPTVARMRAR